MINHNNILFGCSQGRLTKPYNGKLQCFPNNKWIEEFELAEQCGLDFIELFIDEEHNDKNPIWNKKGINEINKFLSKYNLSPYSACISYIINNSIFDKKLQNRNLKYVINAISKLSFIRINLLILPLFDKSDFTLFDINVVKKSLKILLNECNKLNIKLAIESSTHSTEIKKLLNLVNDPNIGYVYDTGNRFEIEDPFLEINTLKEYIVHVHLKDTKNKKNVVIGNGNINFKKVIGALNSIEYQGKYNFETNRGANPVTTMIENIRLIRKILKIDKISS